LALQLIADPDSVPDPEPVTVMLVAQVAVNETFALVAFVGVTVYLRLPQPVAGVLAVADCHVPANASMEVVGVGLVGVSVLSFLPMRSHPAASMDAATSAAAKVDFMILLIVTYDAFLYLCHSRASIPLFLRHLRMPVISIPRASGKSSTSSSAKARTA